MSGAITSLPNTPSWRGAQLRQRDNFALPLPYGQRSLLSLFVCRPIWKQSMNLFLDSGFKENFLTSLLLSLLFLSVPMFVLYALCADSSISCKG